MIDVDIVRLWSHVATASLLTALAIATWLLRGKTLVLHRALLAAMSFGLASAWFWVLSATVRDHALFSRADLIPILAVLEFGFCFLGWAWFVMMATQTFTVVRHVGDIEWTV